MPVPGLKPGLGFRAGAAGPVAVSHTDNAVDTSDLTTYTFSSLSLGTAESGRYIVVSVVGVAGASRTIDTVTIGGETATEVIQDNNVGARPIALFIALVTTGATGDVVVTFSGAMNRAGVGVWKMTGNSSITAHATDSDPTLSDPTTASINVPANGSAIAMAVCGGATSFTWTAPDEDFDATLESAQTYSGASKNYTAAQSPLAVSADQDGGSANTAHCVAASWGP